MIKIRLVRLLSHAKKYIVYNVLWQWAALLLQIGVIFTVTGILCTGTVGTLGDKVVHWPGPVPVGCPGRTFPLRPDGFQDILVCQCGCEKNPPGKNL